MISDVLLIGIYYVVYGITFPLTLLDDVSEPANVVSSVVTAGKQIRSLAEVYLSTYETLIIVFFLVVGVEAAIFAYKNISWLIKKIPGIN